MLLKMINKCIIRDSIYCPIYYDTVIMETIDIILFKWIGSSIKFCCSVSELAIAYSRMINVLELKTKLAESFNKLKYKYFCIIALIIGLILNSIKF